MEEPLMNVDQVAAFLSLSRDHVYRIAAANEIPHVKIGRALRFVPSKVREWIESNSSK